MKRRHCLEINFLFSDVFSFRFEFLYRFWFSFSMDCCREIFDWEMFANNWINSIKHSIECCKWSVCTFSPEENRERWAIGQPPTHWLPFSSFSRKISANYVQLKPYELEKKSRTESSPGQVGKSLSNIIRCNNG